MKQTSKTVRRTYYVLTAGNTLAASLIWGINTIFLLDAGLSRTSRRSPPTPSTPPAWCCSRSRPASWPTRWGRRASFLCGTVTLAVTTGLYVLLWQLHAPFVWWAIVSALLGLGFTFFSGATEAWLVDALTATGFDGSARGGLLPRPGGQRGDDAGRLGGRWLSGPADQSRRAVRRSGPAILVGDVRRRHDHDARPRLHPGAR